MYQKNGKSVSLEEVQAAAKALSMSVEDWASEYGWSQGEGEPGKTDDSVAETAAVESVPMTAGGESISADTSLEQLEIQPPKSFLIDQGEIAGKRGEREAQNSIEIENFLGTVSQQSSEAFNPGIIQDLVEESTEPKTNYYNGTVTTLDESIDMQVEENDLELETQDANAYFNQENNNQFVNDYYDPAGLEAIGVNINDFQGYLNKIDFSEDFEEDLQAGVYGSYDEDDAASLAVAKERAIATALGNYIGDTDAKANEKEFLKDYEANPEKYNDTEDFREAYKKYAEENKLGTLYNSNQASEYAENNFQNLLEKEKQSAEKRDAEYARKQSMGNSGIASTSAYNFLEGTAEGAYAEAMSMVNFIDDKLGFDAIAKQRRILTAEDGYADASKALDYMHIKGDGVTWVDGKEYIRDYDGNLYNKTDNTRVSGVIPVFEEESINKAIDKDGAFMSDWSATGTSATVGGVTGALIFQIAGQYGLGLGVKGAAKLASASGATTRALATANGYSSVKKYNKAVSLLKGTKGKVWTGKKFTTLKGAKDFKLPVSQKIIESTVFQSMYGGVTGYEGTLQAAKEAGLSNEEAESLALQAQTEMGVLYAATGPINPRLRALEKLDNIIAGGNIFKQAVNNFKKAGNSKLIFRETLAKKGKEAMRSLAKGGNSFLQEGGKETIQENVQQAGEYLIVNKGLNEEAGVDFLKDTYTQQDIVDTSILSAAVGGLSGGNLKLNFKANQNERLQNLFFVGKDIKSAKTKFDYLVKKGKITQKEADTIIEQAEAVANTSEGIPSWMQNSPEAIIESAVILNKIKKLEADKKRLAETYHEEVNNDIEAAYSELKTIKDKAAKELTIKEAAKVTKIAGKENVTTYNSVDEMKAAGVDESKLNSDGIFEKDGKIIINLEVAARTKAISVGSHELLHRILRSELKNNKNLGKVINEFRDILKTSGELENIEKRLQFGIDQGVYDIKFNKDGTVSGADIDEYITFFSDAVAKNEISFGLLEESGWKKIGRVIVNAFQTRFGTKAKEFKSGKQVFNFIRDYRSTLDKSGKLTNQAKSKLKASEKVLDGDAKKSLTKPTVLESINSLVPDNVTTKAEFQNRKVFNAVYAATEPGGAISNYVRSKSESKEVADKAMESVVDRLINYDPAAVRKKANGDPITFGEFIFANTNFGKLDARKSLAIEAKETARKVSIDSEQAKEIADKDTATDPRDTGKPKRMNLVTRGVISAEAVSKAQETVKRAIGALKVPFNKKTSLNVTVKPYIAALKKGFAEKELVKAVAQDMGNGGDLKSWMRKHKAAILDNMTTTYLIGAFPAAIQKQVKGTDTWTSDWAGKEIQREKTTTANAGRTSGAFMVRRLPNASSKISDAEFVGMLFDDKGVIKPGKKPSLAKAIAEEIGFDIMTAEIQNPDGQIAEAFKDNQEALGVVLFDNYVAEATKDAERGSAKFSISPAQVNELRMHSDELLSDLVLRGGVTESRLKASLIKVYIDNNKTSLTESQLKEIAKKGHAAVGKYLKKKEDIGEADFVGFVINGMEQLEASTNLLSALELTAENVFGSFKAMMDIKSVQDERRAVELDYNSQLVEKEGMAGIIKILKWMGGHNYTSTKIGQGRGQYYANKNDYYNNNIALIPGVTISGKKVLYKGEEVIFKSPPTQKAYKTVNGKKVPKTKQDFANEYDERKEQAKEAWGLLTDFLAFVRAQNNPLLWVATMKSLDSNMGSMLKAAANVEYYFVGESNSELRYEHIIPTNYIMLQLTNNFWNKKIDLKALQEVYSVAIVPTDMDENINLQFKSTMPLKWNPLRNPAYERYYNSTTFGMKYMRALEKVGGKESGTIYGQEWVNANKIMAPYASMVVAENRESDEALNKASAKFSITQEADMSKEINNMIERTKGVQSEKVFSAVQAKKRGKTIGKYNFFSSAADDFRGLTLYTLAGKGKQGEADQKFLEDKLVKPYQRGINAIDVAKQTIKNDYAAVVSAFKPQAQKMRKKIPNSDYTYDQAIRVYMWTRQGVEVPGMSKRDLALLNKAISQDPAMIAFADAMLLVSKQGEWMAPSEHWLTNTVLSELNNMSEKVGRKVYLEEFLAAKEIIFSPANLAKLEAVYGSKYLSALKDSLYRMENGTNRPSGNDAITNKWLNWINQSTGAIMFFNRRSAALQLLSTVNFINWSDNNPAKAAMAFANQKQFWADFAMLFNSPKLKQRRAGLKTDVTQAEIANAVAGQTNKAAAALNYLLKKGFTFTQVADAFAIASGGASFYRNRVNTYLKQGMAQKEAEALAFEEFSSTADESQQSSDPMLISQQQASVLGRLVLAFQNTTMQYTRLMKKSTQDLINRRGDPKTNISKIIYYGAVQNFVFSALQSALFSFIPGFDDEDDEDKTREEKLDGATVRIINSMIDSILKGSGLTGAVISTLKNAAMKYVEQEEKGYNADHIYTFLSVMAISPPMGSKLSKLYKAQQTKRFEKDALAARPFGVVADGRVNLGPGYRIVGNLAAAVGSVPLDRVVDEITSISEALDSRNTAWQRLALAIGWKAWAVGAKNEEHDLLKEAGEKQRDKDGKAKAAATREANKKAERERIANMGTAERSKYEEQKVLDKINKKVKKLENR